MLEEENKDNNTLMGNQEGKANDAKAEMQTLLQSPEERNVTSKINLERGKKSRLEKNGLKMFPEQL